MGDFPLKPRRNFFSIRIKSESPQKPCVPLNVRRETLETHFYESMMETITHFSVSDRFQFVSCGRGVWWKTMFLMAYDGLSLVF